MVPWANVHTYAQIYIAPIIVRTNLRHIHRQTDTQAHRQTDRQTHTQTHRQTERHTDHASPVAIGRIYALHACDAAKKNKFSQRNLETGRIKGVGGIFHWRKLTVTPASREHCIRQPAFHLCAVRLSCTTKSISLDFSIGRHRFSLKVRLLEGYLDSCIKQGPLDPFDFIPETACRRSVQPILQSSPP